MKLKLSTFYGLTVILLVFFTVQAWLLNERIWSPARITTEQAVLLGVTAEVKAPLPGQLQSVAVSDQQRVTKGQTIAVLKPQAGKTVTVTAPRDGIVTDVLTTPGVFVQVNERIASIVDASPGALKIGARLRVAPEDAHLVRPRLLADVRADYLNGGKPMQAVVTAVDPRYDAQNRSIDVQLRILDLPKDFALATVGLPVELEFERGSAGSVFARIAAIFNRTSSDAALADGPSDAAVSAQR